MAAFSRIAAAAEPATLEIEIDSRRLPVPAGASVAAALLLHGRQAVHRAAVSGLPRGPYCMMGVCFDCLVEIDGRPGQQACLAEVRPGMRIRVAPEGSGR
ncbi:(2Fe-2S)-binding protein [Inquilinus sp. YAF38]|uniref:(2Fe-2S)-binding protein n=1 Tax=Inquilinus sp. YAF38 TaxID=3233084 RepID=UPI003F922F41